MWRFRRRECYKLDLTMRISVALLVGLFTDCLAFVPRTSFSPRRDHALSMSLRPLYNDLSAAVANRLGLKVTDFCETLQAQTWKGSTAEGTAEWLAEASPQYLTGVSTCTRINNSSGPKEELTINIWMGPSYDVPHMLITFGEDKDGLYHVTADYVPRGATVMGGDPQYLERYYGPDVQSAWQQAYQSATALPPVMEFDTRLLQSPAYMSVTGLSASQAEELIRVHIRRFLSFVETAEPIPARLRGSFNMRDDKLRQFFFRGQVKHQVASLGDLGQTVAAGNTGPTAEAYVGGGS